MALTLPEKIANLHAAEESVRKALADFADASTGEFIAQDRSVVLQGEDPKSGIQLTNVGGKIVKTRVPIFPHPGATA